jgi:hypothetical protein
MVLRSIQPILCRIDFRRNYNHFLTERRDSPKRQKRAKFWIIWPFFNLNFENLTFRILLENTEFCFGDLGNVYPNYGVRVQPKLI